MDPVSRISYMLFFDRLVALNSTVSPFKKNELKSLVLRIFSLILFVGFIADLHLILIKVGSWEEKNKNLNILTYKFKCIREQKYPVSTLLSFCTSKTYIISTICHLQRAPPRTKAKGGLYNLSRKLGVLHASDSIFLGQERSSTGLELLFFRMTS